MSAGQDRLDPVRDLTDERIPIGGTPGFATLNVRMGRTFGCCDQHRFKLKLGEHHGSTLLGPWIRSSRHRLYSEIWLLSDFLVDD